MATRLDFNTLLGLTRTVDRNGNNQIDRSEAKVLGSVNNRNGYDGTRETAEAIERGEAALSDFQLGLRDADAIALDLAHGDAWISKDDLAISDAARSSIDGLAGGARDNRISRSELSAALQRGGLALSTDGLMLSQEAEDRFGYSRPTPPPVGRPVPPAVDRPVPPAVDRPVPPAVNPAQGRALETLQIAQEAARTGYSSRATEAYAMAITQCVESREALQIAQDAAQRGYSTSASNAFSAALSLSRTSAEALEITQEARRRGYSTRATEGYATAVRLSYNPAELTDLALDAAGNGYSTSATQAFGKAVQQSRYADEALSIARTAAQRGYSTTATQAFARSIELSTSRTELLQIADEARRRGYSTSASEALRKATYLP